MSLKTIENQLAGFLELVKILNAAPSLAGAKVVIKQVAWLNSAPVTPAESQNHTTDCSGKLVLVHQSRIWLPFFFPQDVKLH